MARVVGRRSDVVTRDGRPPGHYRAFLLATGNALVQKFTDVIPMGRPADMEEVASMVAYLASDEASYVTGQVLRVNGGMYV